MIKESRRCASENVCFYIEDLWLCIGMLSFDVENQFHENKFVVARKPFHMFYKIQRSKRFVFSYAFYDKPMIVYKKTTNALHTHQ